MTTTENDLEISRFLAVSRARVWKAWSDPKNLAQWWCPAPWKTEVRKFDFRAGGDFYTHMTGPDGQGGTGESDNPGCFLEIVPLERIVTTSLMVGGWRPVVSWLPMTAIVTMADETKDGVSGTRYVARVLHLNDEDRKKHEDMGFYEGWGTCITQLEAFAQRL